VGVPAYEDLDIGMLQSLGEVEMRSVLAEQSMVQVHCDFCNRAYEFDSVDVGKLFAPGIVPGGGMVH
jgi:molecular chaperone Hsp33